MVATDFDQILYTNLYVNRAQIHGNYGNITLKDGSGIVRVLGVRGERRTKS